MNLSIIYEDEHILVINKPAGVPVETDIHHADRTLIQEIQEQYPDALLAHRLDKDTSGLLVVAKNAHAHEYLKGLFKKREVKKTYVALVSGIVTKDKGVISLSIARSKKDFRKRIALPHAAEGARAAETRFKVLKRFSDKNYTLMELYPKTGRTHQIRSHMASIGHPVACDKLYGGKRYACPVGLNRQFLHAAGLEFSAKDSRRIRLEVELPDDLQQTLENISDMSGVL